MSAKTILPALAALLATGCSYDSLVGNYVGDVECGDAGSVGMEFVILKDKGAGVYDAEGEIQSLTIDGEAADIRMEGEVLQGAKAGAQALEVSVDCAIVQEDGTTAMDCAGFDELAFDGENTLTAEVAGFLGTEADCTLSLSR